jgi:FlaA1/EpsC-like NDP-sugar epimerase
LCRQIAAYRPRQLVLVDINESGLHDLGVELRARDATAHFALALCDITNSNSIESVFGQFKPQVVFHAAAYKHVPMLEQHPAEAVRVNVLGTRLVHALADQFGVERFILISTDKAANPSSVLGMTKWIGELMVTLPARAAMLSAAVRFGNVLGSRGSVVATFEKQIELGSPLTITHPEMTRYFLSLGEAISLVIQAAAMTRGGEIYILDMGVPVRIVDLAARVIRAHGLRPDQDVAIEFVGPRPGEKLNEELVGQGEEKAPTEHRSIFRIRRSNPIHLEQLQHHVDALLHLSANGTAPDQVRAKLQDCVHAINDSRD